MLVVCVYENTLELEQQRLGRSDYSYCLLSIHFTTGIYMNRYFTFLRHIFIIFVICLSQLVFARQ